MEKLRTPLQITAVYVLLIGLSTLAPGLVRTIFGYEVKDPGVLLVLSAAYLGLGVVLWGIASDPAKNAGLATSVVIALVISAVFLVWGWLAGMFTPRNILVPLIIDVVLAVWIWSAKPKP